MNTQRLNSRRRAGKAPGHPERIELQLPEGRGPRAWDWILAGGALVGFGMMSVLISRLPVTQPPKDEVVEWMEEKVPPPPQEIKEPPKPPPPPPPDPDVAPPPKTEEVKPVFGIPEDATSENGDFAVATGNSLRVKADSIVQAPPPPLPAAPVELDRTPAFVAQAPAEYPEWAQEQGIEALVLVWVTIDTEGRVTEAALKKGAGRDFDSNAVRAARSSLFQPLVRDGNRLPSRFVVTYEFRLQG